MFLFLTTALAGGTLIYAGIKGESETINGTPIYRAPWALLLAPFTGAVIESSTYLGSTSAGDQPVSLTQEQTVANPVQAVQIGLQNFAAKVRSGAASVPKPTQSV